MHIVLAIEPFDIFTNQTLDISGGAVPTLSSDPIPVKMISKLSIFVGNSGASTNCTVTLCGKPSATSLLSSTLEVFTLSAGTELVPFSLGKHIDQIPSYVYAVITNADAENTAIISVVLDMTR